MITKLVNLIKYALKSASRPDDKAYPTMQISYMGKLSDALNLTPYGLYYNLPVNSTCAVFNAVGASENLFAIGNTPTLRFKNLEEGELVIGSPLSRSNTRYKTDGDVEIDITQNEQITIAGNSSKIADGALTIEGVDSLSVTSTGVVTISGSSVVINASVTVNGALNATGAVVTNSGLPGEVNLGDLATEYNAHIHVDSLGGNTGTPV